MDILNILIIYHVVEYEFQLILLMGKEFQETESRCT